MFSIPWIWVGLWLQWVWHYMTSETMSWEAIPLFLALLKHFDWIPVTLVWGSERPHGEAKHGRSGSKLQLRSQLTTSINFHDKPLSDSSPQPARHSQLQDFLAEALDTEQQKQSIPNMLVLNSPPIESRSVTKWSPFNALMMGGGGCYIVTDNWNSKLYNFSKVWFNGFLRFWKVVLKIRNNM